MGELKPFRLIDWRLSPNYTTDPNSIHEEAERLLARKAHNKALYEEMDRIENGDTPS